jgi:hypothetical protein
LPTVVRHLACLATPVDTLRSMAGTHTDRLIELPRAKRLPTNAFDDH